MTIRYPWRGAEGRVKGISQTIALIEKKYPKIKGKTDFPTYGSFREESQERTARGNPPEFSKTPSHSFASTTSGEFSWASAPGFGPEI
ncbi:hypothetical protein JK361_23265 [Streptomyces sp. 5-8]|uniref:Uncharacterized protein n=1 Tax=Streptomyces musisoli TaxID=2802280 RepID=A0ABS1P597_9ACTN|nr:hypothetical protein [Streptomyces musisoli]MBL1107488.1 hypothetical protein [Streptomyces musisoli]